MCCALLELRVGFPISSGPDNKSDKKKRKHIYIYIYNSEIYQSWSRASEMQSTGKIPFSIVNISKAQLKRKTACPAKSSEACTSYLDAQKSSNYCRQLIGCTQNSEYLVGASHSRGPDRCVQSWNPDLETNAAAYLVRIGFGVNKNLIGFYGNEICEPPSFYVE